MIPVIEENRQAIIDLCHRYGVQRLALFGSATRGTYDAMTSDLDFVVDLGSYDTDVSRRYLGFIVALQTLFGHHVDVVTERSVTSPAFRNELDNTSVVIYEADNITAFA